MDFAGYRVLLAQPIVRYIGFTIASGVFFLAAGLFFPRLPGADRFARALNSRLYVAAVAILSPGLIWWTWHFGNVQFGAFDHGVLIDTGWRLWNGQKPYIDFICTLPPGFFIGVKYAFQLFGPSWNAQLYFSGCFAALTFLWLYWLFARLLSNRALAALAALVIEATTSLIVAYWWYNPVTSIAATVFLLSAFLCCSDEDSPGVPALLSLAAALFLLLLMKPNIALPLACGAFAILLARSEYRWKLFLAGSAASIAFVALLWINDVTLPQLLSSYLDAAKGRAKPVMSIREMGWVGDNFMAARLFFLALPWIQWTRRVVANRRDPRRGEAMRLCLFPLATLVGLYGMLTNGELKQVDMPLLIAAGVVLLFGPSETQLATADWQLLMKRAYVGFLCAFLASSLYAGAIRQRVQRIGDFFEWDEELVPAGHPFFKNVTAPSRFSDVIEETQTIVNANQGRSIFFGPRMEFCYATFGLPSPKGLPIWWHPGTSFGADRTGALLEQWKQKKFDVLVFLKDDFTYYPAGFKNLIDTEYVMDNTAGEISVAYRQDRHP